MKILHLDKNHPLLLEQLEQAGHDNMQEYTADKADVMKQLEGIEGIVIRSRFRLDQAFMDAAPDLRFIARVGAGLESIDTDYAVQKGIILINSPEGNRNAVGEHALGLLLALTNKLLIADREVKAGNWNREANRGMELEGKTVGLIGYGNMGKAFAKKLKGFNCEVLFYDILPDLGDEFAKQVSLTTLQQRADVLSLHTPWTPRTDKMVDAHFIQAFSKPFYLINTARGKSVVTSDLVDALKSGQIKGAGLDVLEFEQDSFEKLFQGSKPSGILQELLTFPNVIVSPHIAGWTQESKVKLAQVIVDKILALDAG
ncbi:NAD(P)-dependent oxidoreductase [Croceiramulus getboli]|nr:NAD(P)-dependent oxidoreductase [Flavobacteriaceae bacterium YJPT1-3]